MDGVKQATTLVFVAVYSFNYEMGHDEKETKFLKTRSKYAVSNDLHFTIYSDKLTFDVDGTYEFHSIYGCKGPGTHFYYKACDTSGCISKQYTVFTENTNNEWIDVTFFGILEHLLVIVYLSL